MAAFPEFREGTGEIREWFYWTNYSRLRPRAFWDSVVAPILQNFPNLKSSYSNSLKRDLYRIESLGMLKLNRKLGSIAQSMADEMRSRKAPPSHTSPSGVSFQSRMTLGGINNCAGENISFGPGEAVLGLVFLYIDEGISDLGHRKALLSPEYTEMGVGLSKYPHGNKMVIQDFACKQD